MELSTRKPDDFLKDPKIQSLKSYPFFQKVDKILQEDGARFRAKFKMIFVVHLVVDDTNETLHLTLDLKNQPGVLSISNTKNADGVIILKDSTLQQISDKKLRTSHALLQRKVVFKGNPLSMIKLKSEAAYIKAKL